MNHPRPRIFFSRCLGFANCRWNAETIDDDFVTRLLPFVDAIHDCPEMGIALGCPRPPLRRVRSGDGIELYQPATGLRCGEAMREWSSSLLSSLPPVDGFLLKSRSPSCGWKDVKIYDSFDPGSGSRAGSGIFGQAVLDARPGIPVEDEGRIRNFTLREGFLGAVFTLARLRAAEERGDRGALVEFHTVHKLYFLLLDQAGMRQLGTIVANHERKPASALFPEYRTRLLGVLAREAEVGSLINVIQHAFGGFSDSLSKEERKLFADMVEQYRDERIPASVLFALVRAWAVRFGNTYLLEQVVFEPYPPELVLISDSGKGRSGC